jgi:hypothetical protein
VEEMLEHGEPVKELPQGETLLAQLKALNQKARELAAQATGAGDYRTALMAVRELARLLELTTKLTAELDGGSYHDESHLDLSADRALAIAKAYVERHGADVATPSSAEVPEVDHVVNEGNGAAFATIKQEGDDNKS